jgi:sortase A
MRSVQRVERLLLVMGLALLGLYLGARIHGALLSRAAIARISSSPAGSSADAEDRNRYLNLLPADFSRWSEKRIQGYKESLVKSVDPPLAILRVGRIHLEAPIFDGTDDLILNRGVGRIVGTARVGTNGNVGIAGHRDGFFRGLKDVRVGDTMDLVTPSSSETYVVDRIQIVDPKDVSVLRPAKVPSLTLVTCYPFYFIGSAPQRYVVHASITDSDQPSNNALKLLNSTVTKKNNQEITK